MAMFWRRFWPEIFVCGVIIAASFIYYKNPDRQTAILAYHPPQFLEYARFISEAITQARTAEKVGLKRVLGGVTSHHIPTTAPALADFYWRLKNTRNVKTFIIIGPDHIDAGKEDIVMSQSQFANAFGVLQPNLPLIKKLVDSGLASVDEKPFDREHSISSQLFFIKKIFPDATIVPIIFRSSGTLERARQFGRLLGSFLNDEVFIVASVDFSHYFSEAQARPIDILSMNVLRSLDAQALRLVDADSKQSLAALVAALETAGANQYAQIKTFNTADFNGDRDYTTGYVFGFWGTQ